jgi:hypothetical protein
MSLDRKLVLALPAVAVLLVAYHLALVVRVDSKVVREAEEASGHPACCLAYRSEAEKGYREGQDQSGALHLILLERVSALRRRTLAAPSGAVKWNLVNEETEATG